LDKVYPDLNICFERDIKQQMNKLTTDIFRSVYTKLDPKRRLHCMEVFGLDFMIDDEFKPYLIEVNTNPCLELASPLLSRLIPTMLENALKIGLDAIFLPPESFSTKKAYIGDPCPENRFEMVFDSIIDGPVLEKLFKNKENMIVEMDEDELSEEEEHDDEE
jgi:tubulin polyglutamylase TTLL1